jgi:hypothetical protein
MSKRDEKQEQAKPQFPVDETLNKRVEPVQKDDPANNEPTKTGGPRNTGQADPVGPAEGGAALNPVYRPGQRAVGADQLEGSVETAPPAAHIPYGSEPRTYDPATGLDHPDYRPVADENVRTGEQARELTGTGTGQEAENQRKGEEPVTRK